MSGSKKRPRSLGSQQNTFYEEISFGTEKVVILQRIDFSPNFYVQLWIPNERKYVRKSLKTTDLVAARKRAEEIYWEVRQDLAVGKQIFGITLEELVQKYLDYRWNDVLLNKEKNGAEGITQERWGTIRSQLSALLRIKSGSMKLSEFDANTLFEYRQMRFQDNPHVGLHTIRNETATIGAMWKFGYPKYTNIPKLEFRPLKISKEMKKQMRRDTFTPEEYKRVTRYLRSWVSKKECPDPDDRLIRQFIRDYFLLLSNTCMRVGELKQLKWGDITKLEKGVNTGGIEVTLVSINIRAETSKTRASRSIVTRGGEYFKRVRTYSKFIGQDDFIFPNLTGRNPMDDRMMYSHWDDLMCKTGFPDHKERKLSFYSLRHYAITDRLRDLSIWEVSNLAGTGVQFIEEHYGHVFEEDKKVSALKYSQRPTASTSEVDWTG